MLISCVLTLHLDRWPQGGSHALARLNVSSAQFSASNGFLYLKELDIFGAPSVDRPALKISGSAVRLCRYQWIQLGY